MLHDPAATTARRSLFLRTYLEPEHDAQFQSSGCSLGWVPGVIFCEARPCCRVPSIAEAIWSDVLIVLQHTGIYQIAAGLLPSVCNFTILLDACHSGGFHESAPDMRTRTIDFDQDLVQAIIQYMQTIIPCGVCLAPNATDMSGNVSNVQDNGNGVVCSVDDNKSRFRARSPRLSLPVAMTK